MSSSFFFQGLLSFHVCDMHCCLCDMHSSMSELLTQVLHTEGKQLPEEAVQGMQEQWAQQLQQQG